ncbi:hypothetical protein ACFSCX_24015 [Bacillus salitolerans]|uniref:Uncharacterized protein n=1 Tax=Bacillus salitolerans TaxID=1437434 RepID=A0ABW4LWQ7_9BACI
MSNDDILELFNKPFLEEGIKQGKKFVFSHNPINDRGFLGRELDYLESKGYYFDVETMSASKY